MSGSRKMLRRYQSYGGKKPTPKLWRGDGRIYSLAGCKEVDNYISLATHRERFCSAQALCKCASKVFAQGPTTRWADLGRNTGQNFPAKPSTWYLVHFLYPALQKALFLQKFVRIKITGRDTRTYGFCVISIQIHTIPSKISHQLCHLACQYHF